MVTKLRDAALVLGVGFLIGYSGVVNTYVVREEPYSSPEIESVEHLNDNELIVSITFKKNANSCVWGGLRVLGYLPSGQFRELSVEDVEGDKGDRLAGWHTIHLKLTGVSGIAFIEGYTRHFCSDVKRDRVLFQKSLGGDDAP